MMLSPYTPYTMYFHLSVLHYALIPVAAELFGGGHPQRSHLSGVSRGSESEPDIIGIGPGPFPGTGPGDNNGKNPSIVSIKVQSQSDIQHIADEYDILDVNKNDMTVSVLLHPSDKAKLDQEGYSYTIDETATTDFLVAAAAGIAGYPCYRTVEETYATGAALASQYPDIVEWNDIGDTWEKVNNAAGGGYDIFVLKITNKNVVPEGGARKPVFFANCAIHAREYTTAELCTRFAESLIFNYGMEAEATALIDHHEIHLVLQSNPDGRKMAEGGKLWRKNKNNNVCTNKDTRGVDLNRNFPFKWGGAGSSGSPCTETYRGVASGSEPETRAILDYFNGIFPSNQRGANPADSDPSPLDAMGVALDIHSYGGLVLYPWGFTTTPCGNYDQFATFGRKLAYFNGYAPQASYELYFTTGTTGDAYYGSYGVAAFGIELGNAFFESCTAFENTILPDNLKTLMYAAKVARTPFMTPAGPDAYGLGLSKSPVPKGQSVTLTATLNDGRYNGAEATQNIVSASVYVDIPPWATGATAIPMMATDGAFDSTIENVNAVIDTTSLPSGKHILYVVGTDADGNKGAFSAIHLEIIQGTCIHAGANTGNVCDDDSSCLCSRRLRGLQATCDGAACSSQSPCCPGFSCKRIQGVRKCVSNSPPPPPPPPTQKPTSFPSKKPSGAPSSSSAPSLLVCGCQFSTSSLVYSPDSP